MSEPSANLTDSTFKIYSRSTISHHLCCYYPSQTFAFSYLDCCNNPTRLISKDGPQWTMPSRSYSCVVLRHWISASLWLILINRMWKMYFVSFRPKHQEGSCTSERPEPFIRSLATLLERQREETTWRAHWGRRGPVTAWDGREAQRSVSQLSPAFHCPQRCQTYEWGSWAFQPGVPSYDCNPVDTTCSRRTIRLSPADPRSHER